MFFFKSPSQMKIDWKTFWRNRSRGNLVWVFINYNLLKKSRIFKSRSFKHLYSLLAIGYLATRCRNFYSYILFYFEEILFLSLFSFKYYCMCYMIDLIRAGPLRWLAVCFFALINERPIVRVMKWQHTINGLMDIIIQRPCALYYYIH